MNEDPAGSPDPRKVLVVDDERDLADLAAALLCGHGLDVRVAYGAREALHILAHDPEIDAVFSDVMMPGMTGLQLAEAIGCLYPSVKVVLCSGYTAPALMAGHRSYRYAAKPYLIETVLKLLRR
ncbi:response regulator [Massilia sp. GCM10023247]|uniref:response regulator n=1 Tax=Massilia sp. GCM10023247 TaxID=3252643 RepID=UPI003619522F